jgi:predicted 3-demethylubiquinone-9 3-methyltransferase (glyoxalase superfamily)
VGDISREAQMKRSGAGAHGSTLCRITIEPMNDKEQLKGNYMQKITPCLWFDSNAEAAAKFYTSIFKNSKIGKISRYGKEGYEIHGKPAGSVLTVEFELDGQTFTALNGGPIFKFNEAISFQVSCESQEELDYYWESLSKGGDDKAQQCGWLKDRYGVSWQIVPTIIGHMLGDKDANKAERVMKALLQMKKLDIEALKKAYEHG